MRRLAFAPGDDAGGEGPIADGGQPAGALAFRMGVVPWPIINPCKADFAWFSISDPKQSAVQRGPSTAPDDQMGASEHCAAVSVLRCRAGAEMQAEPLDRSVGGVVEGAGFAKKSSVPATVPILMHSSRS